uniref:Uncharacterized protein n=1 Tax=Lepeophtheirus salmonis TaxID=72036 RepID=A0A0K2UDS7_LEPSM
MNFLILFFFVPFAFVTSNSSWPWFVTFNFTKPEPFQTIMKVEDYNENTDRTTPPACIIATMNMSLIHGSSYENIPENALISGACYRMKQILILNWKSPGKRKQTLAFTFNMKENNNITLDSIDGLLDINGVPLRVYPFKRSLNLFETPFRYCYSCYDPKDIHLMSANKNVVILRFNMVIIETFRSNPFARSFTHLVWNCRYAWMIAYVPLVIGTFLAILVICMILSFVFRKNMGF